MKLNIDNNDLVNSIKIKNIATTLPVIQSNTTIYKDIDVSCPGYKAMGIVSWALSGNNYATMYYHLYHLTISYDTQSIRIAVYNTANSNSIGNETFGCHILYAKDNIIKAL